MPGENDKRNETNVDERAGVSAWRAATAGTYADRAVPKPFLAAVLALALAMALVPFLGMAWAPTDATTENRELASVPSLFDDEGAFNVNVLADAGAYFDDHFAYRSALVDANARLMAALGVSATDQVVVGDGGWLYYGGTLPDYLGQNELSDRALRNIAHNMAFAQAYSEEQGASFAFLIAPNKNTLYPQHMPSYYLRSPAPSNAERLAPLLEAEGVNYVDALALFEGEDDVRYLKRDSHWDNRGALMAAQALLGRLGCDALDLDEADAAARDDFTGDLASMLYPVSAPAESNWYFEGIDDGDGMSGSRWSYAEGAGVEDSWARTESGGEGDLLMFRDSFGNALDPFMATAFGRAAFSKMVPYDFSQVGRLGADAVVVERAERHLGYLAENPPILPARPVQVDLEGAGDVEAGDGSSTLSVAQDGPYWRIEGALDASVVDDDTKIYVVVRTAGGTVDVFDAAWKTASMPDGTQSDFGYQAHIDRAVLDLHDATIDVYATVDGSYKRLKSLDFDAGYVGQ